jgi:hypothetical protein
MGKAKTKKRKSLSEIFSGFNINHSVSFRELKTILIDLGVPEDDGSGDQEEELDIEEATHGNQR